MSDEFPRGFGKPTSKAWHGNIPMGHTYTMGVAGERFFQALRQRGELTASVHAGADQPLLPPRIYHPDSFAPASDWVTVDAEGEVETFTVFDAAGGAPRVLALVHIDGASGGLVHWIGGCEPDEVSIGMRVRAKLAPEAERHGALNDIRYFEPA